MKKAFYIGAVAGGLLGIIVSLSMDLLLGKTLGGGWTEAVAHDLNELFRTNLPQNHVIVIIGTFAVIGIIAAFGSFIGGVFSVMVTRLLHMLIKEK